MLIRKHDLVVLQLTGPHAGEALHIYNERGSGPGQLEDPEDLAIDGAGRVFVTDEDNRRIHVLDEQLHWERSWDVPFDPEAIGVFEDRVYVSYAKAGMIDVFDMSGVAVLRIGDGRSGRDGLGQPDSVCFSPDGELYVVDQEYDRIMIFDPESGRRLRTFGDQGSEPGEFQELEDLLVTPDGLLIVGDGDNGRVQILNPDGSVVRVID